MTPIAVNSGILRAAQEIRDAYEASGRRPRLYIACDGVGAYYDTANDSELEALARSYAKTGRYVSYAVGLGRDEAVCRECGSVGHLEKLLQTRHGFICRKCADEQR